MEKKYFYLIIVIVSFLFIISLFFAAKLKLSPSYQNGTEECKSLYYNGKGAVNIVFFSDEAQTKKYADFFLGISPFNQNKEKFNFFYIDNYKPNCELYSGVAVFCYSSELIKKASSCPSDLIVSLQNMDSKIRSSSYLNVISINENNPLSVFTHEFGHAFAAFDEEYVPAKVSSFSKNCKSDCNDFSNPHECFAGCSDSGYYRSFDSGIMRSLYSNSYGAFDESILLKELNSKKYFSISGNAVSDLRECSKENYYLIDGRYIDGKIEIINKSIETGCSGGNGAGSHHYLLDDKNGNIIISASFNPGIVFTDNQNESQKTIDGEVFSNQENFSLRLPLIENSRDIKIIDGKNKIISSILLDDIGARACKIN